jgi:site-specific recombinase XerD
MTDTIGAPSALVPYLAGLTELRDQSGADGDAELVELWLRNRASRSRHTLAAYRADAAHFVSYLDALGLELRSTKLRDLQSWADSLEGSEATRRRRISTVRSLFSFGQRTGYLLVNVGAAIDPPKLQNDLAQRILTEEQVIRLLNAPTSERDKTIIRWLYVTGARAAETVGLCWKHITPGRDGLVATVHGKGGKTRHVAIKGALAAQLENLRQGSPDDAAVFQSRLGRAMTTQALRDIVRKASAAAGLGRDATPHWFRHSHVSHALDRGAPAHLVQATVGHASLATTTRYSHANPDESSGSYLAA